MPKAKQLLQPFQQIVCSFQGGGALGSYQVGVLEGLQEAGYLPTWFLGTSIGAINAAIAAGNEPKQRIEKMKQFWASIAREDFSDAFSLTHPSFEKMRHYFSAQSALLLGQPGFFEPRLVPPEFGWHDDVTQISYYDTSPLKSTLERYIDFDRINHSKIRLSLGAVEINTGELVFFDSKKHQIRAEHVMASGALPPGFPAVEIDGHYYWDGGISSNSPVKYVLTNPLEEHTLCFMVHLFDSYGLLPKTLDEVLKRKKDIEFSSKFHLFVDMYREVHQLRFEIYKLSQNLKDKKSEQKVLKHCLLHGWDKQIALVRFLCRGDETELSSKDYEFSKKSMDARMDKGYNDAKKASVKKVWNRKMALDEGISLYDMNIDNSMENDDVSK